MLGLLVGAVASFALNKYLAFKDHASPLLPQLGKYVASVAAAMAVHSSLMWLMVEHCTRRWSPQAPGRLPDLHLRQPLGDALRDLPAAAGAGRLT